MARPATKRDDIIRVARRLFAQRGVKATTVRDIAQAAGVTEGALYRHFASKEDLARFLFAGGAELFYEFLEHAAAEATDAAQRLRLLVAGFFEFAEANAEVFGFVMSQHYEGVGAVPGTHRLPKALFVETLQASMAEGKLRPMEPELGAALVIGMCVQSIFFHQRGLIERSAEEVRSEVCAAVDRVFAL
ncbi:MAG: TetR/AcrR family transcriptional regulator [Armatimonadetes bacterium]|nr:TetR/AcrR family transcriptional regulator [Armatimonadota bacterium]